MMLFNNNKQQPTHRPATDYERWLNRDSPDSGTVPQFEPRPDQQGGMHGHGERHGATSYGRIDTGNSFDQYDPSTVSPPAHQDAGRWPRVPDIITYYGALLILLLLAKYFVETLLQQLRQRREDADSEFAIRHSYQVPSIVVEESELKRGC